MIKGHWYNGITSDSKFENRGSIPRWPAVLYGFFLGVLFSICVAACCTVSTPEEAVEEPSYGQYEPSEPSSMSDDLPFKPYQVPSE